MSRLKYSDILRLNKKMATEYNDVNAVRVSVLSNIVTNQIVDVLEYVCRCDDVNVNVTVGNYDNIIQECEKNHNADVVIVFYELGNIVDGLHDKVAEGSDKAQLIIDKMKGDIDYIVNVLGNKCTVLFNKFSALIFNCYNLKRNELDYICDSLNQYLAKQSNNNLILIDIDRVIAQTSVEKSVDWRFFYSAKAYYTVDFYYHYASFIKPIIMSQRGMAKKAIIFDCDNTLWKGILGEDGFEGIDMSSSSSNGAIFNEVQSISMELSRRGIIVGLCTKNDIKDVEKVIAEHPDMVLKRDRISIIMANWNDKVENLKELASVLNIGLDSMVFVDDADYEVNYVKGQLPQVTVLHVPNDISKYPSLLRENLGLFYTASNTTEDAMRTKMYIDETKRLEKKVKFADLEEYLRSLGLKTKIYVNENKMIARMSQLTNKTNQFNLTTKRYTEKDISGIIDDDMNIVFGMAVEDKYGEYGITGLAIVLFPNGSRSCGVIDTFLMSCRVIGRKVEYALLSSVVTKLKQMGVGRLEATYLKTQKNGLVKQFYNKMGFDAIETTDDTAKYRVMLTEYSPKLIPYIEVSYG